MNGLRPTPPAPPPIFSSRGYGGDDDSALLLADISTEQRFALASLWQFQYESSADGDLSDPDALAARFMARWVGDFAPSGWFGTLKGRTFGAYFHPGDEAPEALIAVRYIRDNSSLERIMLGRHLMVVDGFLLSPSVPGRLRPLLHAALVQAVVGLGEYHQMTVAFLDDFGI